MIPYAFAAAGALFFAASAVLWFIGRRELAECAALLEETRRIQVLSADEVRRQILLYGEAWIDVQRAHRDEVKK